MKGGEETPESENEAKERHTLVQPPQSQWTRPTPAPPPLVSQYARPPGPPPSVAPVATTSPPTNQKATDGRFKPQRPSTLKKAA
jgi:hypothetical protein